MLQVPSRFVKLLLDAVCLKCLKLEFYDIW